MDDKIAKVNYSDMKELDELKSNQDNLHLEIIENTDKIDNILSELGIDYKSKIESVKIDDSHIKHFDKKNERKINSVKSFDEIYDEARRKYQRDIQITDLFTEEELIENRECIEKFKREFRDINRLDKYDYLICTIGALIASAIDILLIGIPTKTKDGLKAGPLSDIIRNYFEQKFPQEKMEKLASESFTKVPYDAQDNRNTEINVEGLSSYYHRLLSLGHDPILGFIVGVVDILNGSMTTIDKKGNIVIQTMEVYSERKGKDIVEAITKQILHLESDITTNMGLPAPFMSLFNLLQFGEIGEEKQTIAEIVQSMYYEGFDFIHFCSQSVSVFVLEIFVRLCKLIKDYRKIEVTNPNLTNGYKIYKKTKITTMLFVSHCETVAINVGKVYITKDPLGINYSEWVAFAKMSIELVKHIIFKKPYLQKLYVQARVDDDFFPLYKDIERVYDEIKATEN